MSRYGVVEERPGRWQITENGHIRRDEAFPDLWYKELAARTYAAQWNHWGGPYDRNNPRCSVPLPDEVSWYLLDVALKHATFENEEEEDIVQDEPVQQSLW